MNKVKLIFENCDVYTVLPDILNIPKEEIVNLLKDSGLRGRGGAGFPTWCKWKMVSDIESEEKYIICNADEGEPGTFKDREILTKVPLKVLGGMAIAAYIAGAKSGIVYLRGEYSFLIPELKAAILEFNNFVKAYLNFRLELRIGSGAYVCGEETALIESMEGKRGEPRNKPPFPTIQGYMNKPTVVNNVETLVFALMICKYKGSIFRFLGTEQSKGSKVFSVSGDTTKPGVYEIELGMTVQEFVDEFGDGDTKAVQVGGASGVCVPRKKFDTTIIGFEGVPTGGSMMLFNSSRSMYNVLNNYLDFFKEESCGQCSPCRVGCQQLYYGIGEIKSGMRDESYIHKLNKLVEVMRETSKCGLGQSVGNSFTSIIENFKEEIIY